MTYCQQLQMLADFGPSVNCKMGHHYCHEVTGCGHLVN